MKKHLLALLIAAGAISTASTQAQVANANPGDVILAFENASINKEYLVDLGAGSNLANFQSINVGTDLATVFGSNWYNDQNLQFGLFGINTAKSAVWASTASGNNAFPIKSAGALSTTSTHFTAIIGNFNADLANGQGLTTGVLMNIGSGSDKGYSTFFGNNPTATAGSAFAVYNQSLMTGINGTLDVFQTGNSAGSSVALFSSAAGSALQIDATGQVIPEPTTYALMGLGALFLVIAYRRKTA